MGTLSKLPETVKYIVTGDKDALQLISDSAFVVLTKKGVTEVKQYDVSELKSEYGLRPDQIIELKSLMGDSSDNIPGVPGVGEKTALKLIGEYGSLDNLYETYGRLAPQQTGAKSWRQTVIALLCPASWQPLIRKCPWRWN